MKLLWIRIKQLTAAVFLGLPVTLWLLLRDKNTVYYIPHAGLGDYCIALGYLDAYKKQHHVCHVTVIVPKSRVEVASFYPYWEKLLVLPQAFYKGVVYFGSIPGGRTIRRRIKRIESVSYPMHLNKKLLYNNPSAQVDKLVKFILKLPDSEKRQAPCVPDIDISVITAQYDLKKGKTIILNPYTGGWNVRELPQKFYEQLTEALWKNGYQVVTILGSAGQAPIAGTQGLVTSLAQAWHLARWCGWVIGTRSGFFDFLQFSGCNLIAIYEQSYKEKEMFVLQDVSNVCVKEYVWDGNSDKELIEEILLDLIK